MIFSQDEQEKILEILIRRDVDLDDLDMYLSYGIAYFNEMCHENDQQALSDREFPDVPY